MLALVVGGCAHTDTRDLVPQGPSKAGSLNQGELAFKTEVLFGTIRGQTIVCERKRPSKGFLRPRWIPFSSAPVRSDRPNTAAGQQIPAGDTRIRGDTIPR